MDDKIITADKFLADTQEFGITSDAYTTFDIFDKDGVGPNPKYDAVRPEIKVCAVKLDKVGAPYTVKFTVHSVPANQGDQDALATNAVAI